MQYTKARQGENKSVTKFAAYLTTLESQITPPYKDRHLQMHLYSRLLPALRTAVANYHEFLHTRQDLVYRASTLEEDLQRSGALPLLQLRDTGNAQNQGSKSKSYQASTKDSKDWKKNVKCFHYGDLGHPANKCPEPLQTDGKTPATGVNTIRLIKK
ncbi:hypothetical protein K504DRAFT_245615 [Pleomassaria siparia CBS 279.74]|uniref:CCHC-type domain-containing protein n=1 Tax=Pleomassaria siparia CBS 279.74 TaxID=1314801 RepID=A0A6G1JPU1_9PLEO|nr:hypothetical protein K504DRAFT_245615 [Pleomassaria siparia CBS 279.74]